MTKIINTVATLIEKAQEKGFARINGRMSYGYGMKGDLEEKYSALIEDGKLTFSHWGTVTLELDLVNKELLYFYGESNSDRDSMNTVMYILGFEERFSYKPVNGGFQLA